MTVSNRTAFAMTAMLALAAPFASTAIAQEEPSGEHREVMLPETLDDFAQDDDAEYAASSEILNPKGAIPDVPLTPENLSKALTCASGDAGMAFAAELFLHQKPIAWMEHYEAEGTEGMLGMYGYRLSMPIDFFGRKVDSVFFMKEWLVTSLPLEDAHRLIAEQKLTRLPVKSTKQYYRFIDPKEGPVLGAFEPTGNALEAALAGALGLKDLPPPPPATTMFVGCNFAAVSEQDLLRVARQADKIVEEEAAALAKTAKRIPEREGEDKEQ